METVAATQIKRPVFNNPFLNITLNPDGTLKRSQTPRNPTNPDPNNSSFPVLSKDVTLNQTNKTWMRLYIPMNADNAHKLPLLLYLHGGGFVFFNANDIGFDMFCKNLVQKIGAMVISLDYRLAPEHRLPAAIEDTLDVFSWLKNTKDEWVNDYADLSNCFMYGFSGGANLAYHAGSVISANPLDFEPVKVRGVIFHQPYFSGSKRTESEEKLANDSLLPLHAIDKMFELSLPEGSDRDHAYCNPFGDTNRWKIEVERMKELGWRFLVTGCYQDPLVDGAINCANLLEKNGVETIKLFRDGYHTMELWDPVMAIPLFDAVKKLIFN